MSRRPKVAFPSGMPNDLRKLLEIYNVPMKELNNPGKKRRLPRKRVLCRIKTKHSDDMVVYRDGTWRYESDDDFAQWKLAHSDVGPIFLYRSDDSEAWRTEWQSDDEEEVKLANTIARALADLEVEKMLSGKTDE